MTTRQRKLLSERHAKKKTECTKQTTQNDRQRSQNNAPLRHLRLNPPSLAYRSKALRIKSGLQAEIELVLIRA